MEQPNEKYIQLLKIKCHRDYSPPKYFSVYEFMRLFIQAIKERYDIEVIEVRYKVSKSLVIQAELNSFENLMISQPIKT